MRHRHRWPYILVLPILLFLPSLLAIPSPSPVSKPRHHQRQLHRLVGGHLRTLESDQDDSELITASAGDDTKDSKPGKGGNEERKTLSQQVADGKYGLIQKELFKKTPKRPGILSYAHNPEVPKDNIATLGGLTKNDIWLAENHLLVIKGGTYPPYDDTKQDYVEQIWQPIDDYNAPLHQVKIPKNPKVPPPFPVQLTDEGPLQILGTNSSRTLNASAETPAYALPPPPGWNGEIPPQSDYFPQTGPSYTDQADPATGQAPLRDTVSGEPPGGLPFSPTLLNGSLPPSFAHLPRGALILPAPIGNETEPLDEDDPSIYYPPPYSFYYPKDNSSLVPPGPLVPGIILPPPPKFFAPLEEHRVTITSTRKPIYTTKYTIHQTTTESPLSNEISTSKPYKTIPTRVSVIKNYSKVTVSVHTSRRTQENSRLSSRTRPQTTKLYKTTIPTTGKPKLITILPVHVDRLNRTYLPVRPVARVKNKSPVTILRPVKTEVATPKVYLYQNEVSDKPFDSDTEQQNEYEDEKSDYRRLKEQKHTFDRSRQEYDSQRQQSFDSQRQSFNRQRPVSNKERQKTKYNNGIVSTTQVPLKYFTTSPYITNSVTPSTTEKFSIGINAQEPKTTTKTPANFFFYEETDPTLNSNSITTEAPPLNRNPNYYDSPNQYYYPTEIKTTTPPPPIRKPSLQPPLKPQFIYVTGTPYESPKPKFRYVSQPQSRPQPQLRPQPQQRPQSQSRPQPQPVPQLQPRPQPQQNSFSIHIANLQNELHYYSTPKTVNRPSSKPVYQYSFEAQNYHRPGKTFRPSPLMDDNEDSFKPIPKYSVQIQPAIQIIPTQQPSYQQIQPLNVEEPSYYSTQRPQSAYHQQYHQEVHVNQGYRQLNNPLKAPAYFSDNSGQSGYVQESQRNPELVPEFHNNPNIVVTPAKPIAEFSYEVTPNPVHQGYYTKPDEGYFDENTRQYFTIFGRKLPSATTPIPIVKRPSSAANHNGIRQHGPSSYKEEHYDRPISLESDINVNYVRPRPPVNPHSEPIHAAGQYNHEDNSPNPEVIKAIEITPPVIGRGNKERYIHYQLPGDSGAHFYFLTPQAAERRRQQGEFFYERDGRMRRENKRDGEKKV